MTMNKTALISVSDKTGVLEFAKKIAAHGYHILSTGGTAKMLQDAGLEVTEVSSHTGYPEMLDGRVKTLHPVIHGGLLARREIQEHMQTLEENSIIPIDLLVVNLYPFEATVAKPDCSLEDAIENIDIGGPAMIRSAAKNWKSVAVLTDSSQYEVAYQEIEKNGSISVASRFELAVAAFNRIANYDAAISNYLSSLTIDGAKRTFPLQINMNYVRLQNLRYGENPHQKASFYSDLSPLPGSLVMAHQHQGKELSYNNIADADAAWECVKSFDAPTCVIVKHANPCGVAVGINGADAYARAFQTDPTSAFGGIIAFNCIVDAKAAELINKQFVEVLIAPAYTPEALALFAEKQNIRVLSIDVSAITKNGKVHWEKSRNNYEIKRVSSGILMQNVDQHQLSSTDLKVVTKKQPTEQQLKDMLFAWKVAHYTKSNAIVFCKNEMTLGVGAGQMSRIDSARIASIKAENAQLSLEDSVVASDAFFPFRDGLDVIVASGATSIIQPGGSMRDQEVIDAADEHGIVMVFSGIRHFKH